MRFTIFDIETRIDKALVRETFFRGEAIDDETAYTRMRQQLLDEREGRSDFFPIPFHVPISVAAGSVNEDWVLTGVETLCRDEYSEEAIVRQFWQRLERFKGVLVSFNGRTFDLPVMELQALRFRCVAPAYFNEARGHRNRYSDVHYDLYDFLTNYGVARIRGGFDVLARIAGLPGKREVDGSMVQAMWERGELDAIHRYCREDVIQTYFLFLRVELMRGHLTTGQFDSAFRATVAFRREIGWDA